jgi:hypothetical protein
MKKKTKKKEKSRSGSENRQLDKLARVRLTEAGFEFAQDCARKYYGGSISAHFRFLNDMAQGLPAPRKVRNKLPDDVIAQLAKISGQLGKTGSNLNQLARANNRGGYVASKDIRAAQQDIEILRVVTLAALGVRDVALEEGRIVLKVDPDSPVLQVRGVSRE